MKFFEKVKKLVKNKIFIISAAAAVLVAGAITTTAILLSREKYDFLTVSAFSYTQDYISPLDIEADGNFMFVSDDTRNSVYKVSAASSNINKTYELGGSANALTVTENAVFAVFGEVNGGVVKLDKNLSLVASAEAGHTPSAVLVDDGRVFVANRFENSVSVYDAQNLNFIKVIKLSGREPISLAAAKGKIYVGCQLPLGRADTGYMATTVCVIDREKEEETTTIQLINGTNIIKDMVVSEDGKHLYVSNIFSRYTYPTTQVDRGWINTNGITVINLDNNEVRAGVLIDDVERGAPNPWGICVDNGYIFVAASGSGEIISIDETEMLKRIANAEQGKTVYPASEIVDRIEFLAGAKKRIVASSVDGKVAQGVRGISVSEGNLFAAKYFDGSIANIELDENGGMASITEISLGNQPIVDAARRGEMLWHDATISYQEWQSCASCHPDARSGALNWDETNDGLGNPKNTKSMIYAYRTPPTMHTAISPTGESGMRGSLTIQNLNEKDAECIDEYLRQLLPTQSPYMNRNGTLTESATAGQQLFNDLSCVSCHSGPNFTNLSTASSKAVQNSEYWDKRDMDVPTLVELWRSAPYMHDGSAATIEDAIKMQPRGGDLTETQLKQLADYVASIGTIGQDYGVVEFFTNKNTNPNQGINTVEPDTTIKKIRVIKQTETDTDALVTIRLFNKDGNTISTHHAELIGLSKGGFAEIKCDIKIPTDFEKGGGLEITISNRKKVKRQIADIIRFYY